MKITRVEEADDGIRLDRWFARHYPAVGHGQLQKALRSKLIRVDGKRAEAGQRVSAGQAIKHPEFAESPKAAEEKVAGQDAAWLREAVLFSNAHVIAINKPAGLATQGGSGQRNHIDRLLPALRFEAKERPKLVHRLDKDTSGVLLLARNARAADALMKAFAGKTAEKTYWALVTGVPDLPQGTINLPLAKQRRGGQEKMAVDKQDGQTAITDYRIVERLAQRLSWLELYPRTGRTHQLRAHLEAIGHPIIGDGKYGGERSFPEGLNLPKQLHLHARRIVIPDLFGERIDVTAPLPEHMRQSWETLGLSL